MTRSVLHALCAALICLVSVPGISNAEDYPSRPITLVVPFPPGGSTTVMARIVGDKLSAALGQQIVVENKGGAGGTIGTRFVAKAAPDGYTILLSYTATMAIAPAMNANAGYDPRKDLTPIGMIGFAPNVLVVHPSLPVHSIAELIAYAKAAPAPRTRLTPISSRSSPTARAASFSPSWTTCTSSPTPTCSTTPR